MNVRITMYKYDGSPTIISSMGQFCDCSGVNVKAVLASFNMAFLQISRSCFKERQIRPLLISLTNVLRFCVNFWVIFGNFEKDIFS